MVSVVIPAFNEEKMIEACLEAFVAQKTAIPFEVILVDNNSTDNTSKLARRYEDKLDLVILHEPKKGRGAARARGFAKAKGDIILSTDADGRVPENWMETLTEKFKDPEVIAVTGSCRVDGPKKLDNAVFNFLQPKFMLGYQLLFGHFWLTGSNFAIRKSIYRASGGFAIHLNALEDIHLASRVCKYGKVLFARDIPVTVSGRRFKNNLMKGLLEYIWSYIGYSLRRKQHSYLRDAR